MIIVIISVKLPGNAGFHEQLCFLEVITELADGSVTHFRCWLLSLLKAISN